MKVEAQDPESGRKFTGVANDLSENVIDDFFNSLNLSDEEIRSWISRLEISADAKTVLYKIANATIRAGQLVIKIGRKILEFVSFLLREYPGATFGSIIAVVIGSLVTSIPIIGAVIGPLFTTLAMIIGLTVGAWQDVKDKALKYRIQQELAMYGKLKTE